MDNTINLVVYMDGNWAGYNPLPPPYEESSLTPVDIEEVEENAFRAIDLMGDYVDGKFVFGVHTGVYCREIFYRTPLINCWKSIVDQGGELALHPHEEVIGLGSLFKNDKHMKAILTMKYEQLVSSRIRPTAFRGGYYGYSAEITPILESLGINVDLSCAPGIEMDEWSAHWQEAPTSAYFLCSEDPSHIDCEHPRSQVLEIPMGWDGKGFEFPKNYLYNEASTLECLMSVFKSVLKRAESEQKPQFVHFLCHLHAMGDDELRTRCSSFLQFAQDQGARVLTPLEAREVFLELEY